MLEALLVLLHVAAGTFALVLAPIAITTRKGGRNHCLGGRVYFWAMAVLFITALGLLVVRPNIFLLIISVLSFYGAFSGTRALARKRPQVGQGPTPFVWGGAWLALAAGMGFIAWGVLTLLGLWESIVPRAFSYLGVGFGVLLSHDAWSDLRSFRQPSSDPTWWWFYHMERMLGSYIAAVTAFMVQTVGPRLPVGLEWTVWIAPGLVGGVGISFWIRYYRLRFRKGRQPQLTEA